MHVLCVKNLCAGAANRAGARCRYELAKVGIGAAPVLARGQGFTAPSPILGVATSPAARGSADRRGASVLSRAKETDPLVKKERFAARTSPRQVSSRQPSTPEKDGSRAPSTPSNDTSRRDRRLAASAGQESMARQIIHLADPIRRATAQSSRRLRRGPTDFGGPRYAP